MNDHPTAGEMESYCRGHAVGEAAAHIEAHLAGCPQCVQNANAVVRKLMHLIAHTDATSAPGPHASAKNTEREGATLG